MECVMLAEIYVYYYFFHVSQPFDYNIVAELQFHERLSCVFLYAANLH